MCKIENEQEKGQEVKQRQLKGTFWSSCRCWIVWSFPSWNTWLCSSVPQVMEH